MQSFREANVFSKKRTTGAGGHKCHSGMYRTKLPTWLKDDLCCRQFSRLQHKVVHELKEDPKPWRH